MALFAAAFAWVYVPADVAIPAPVVPTVLVPPLAEGRLGSVSIGVDDRGDALASWSAAPLVRSVVSVAHQPAGRSRWVISQPLAHGESPQLAVDGRGDAVAIWTSSEPLVPEAPALLEAAVRPAGLGHWRAPRVIARLQPCDGCEAKPSVAIGVGGEVLIVWSEGSEEVPDTPLAVEPGEIIEAVSGSARTGRFEPTAALSRATDFSQAPQAALDGRGDAVVVWEAGLRGTVSEGRAIQAAWRPSGGGWRPPDTLARAGEGLGNPHVVIDADGHAAAVWERAPEYAIHRGEPSAVAFVEAAFGSASAVGWGIAQQLSSSGESASNVQLASAPTGRIVAVWERDSRTSNAIVALGGSTASGTWGSQTTVATWGHVAPLEVLCRGGACPVAPRLPEAAPRVAMNARGDVALAWEQAGAYRPFIRVASWPSSSRDWLSPVRVSAPGASEADVALDSSDDAFVIWQIVRACKAPCQKTGAAIEVAELLRAGR